MKKRPMIIKIILGGYEEEDESCGDCGKKGSKCKCDSEEDDSEEEED